MLFSYWSLPPRLKQLHFTQKRAVKLTTRWAKHCRMQGIFVCAERTPMIRIDSERRKLDKKFFGVTKVYPVALIILGFSSILHCMEKAEDIPVFKNTTADEVVWQTLIHEMAHAASVKVPRTKEDHSISFYIRLIRSYLFVWYHCYFGVLKYGQK
jgi:hypothetical protein